VLVNGHSNPEFASLINGRERWRIVNACTSRFVDLHVDGADVDLIGMDSGQYASPKSLKSFVLAPGNRADAIVTMGKNQVHLAFDSVPHPDAMMSSTPVKDQVIATFIPGESVVGAGPQAGLLPALTSPATQPRDIRALPTAAKRNFSLEMPAMNGMMMHDAQGNMTGFTINSVAFDMDTVNTTVAMNTVEEWTITNTSNMSHPFHLHVWPMQLISVGSQVIDDPQWQDVVIVPPLSKSVVRVAFENHSGITMYHCHILDHEDQGMMGIIRAS
jgi:FtsP/CotA-like multicopper oxidase with cupredoxin domain